MAAGYALVRHRRADRHCGLRGVKPCAAQPYPCGDGIVRIASSFLEYSRGDRVNTPGTVFRLSRQVFGRDRAMDAMLAGVTCTSTRFFVARLSVAFVRITIANAGIIHCSTPRSRRRMWTRDHCARSYSVGGLVRNANATGAGNTTFYSIARPQLRSNQRRVSPSALAVFMLMAKLEFVVCKRRSAVFCHENLAVRVQPCRIVRSPSRNSYQPPARRTHEVIHRWYRIAGRQNPRLLPRRSRNNASGATTSAPSCSRRHALNKKLLSNIVRC